MAGRGSRRFAAGGDAPERPCNLERFLEATAPVVTSSASCSAKESKNNGRRRSSSYADDDDAFPFPFFTLCDLWDSFRERSAYGTPVPIVLNGCCRDEIVQYYVPYLSAIQLYGGGGSFSSRRRRHVVVDGPSRTSEEEESDGDCCQLDTGSDLERETSSSTNAFSAQETSEETSSSNSSDEDEGGPGNYHYQQERLLFEFVESEPPYQRQPLADKVSSLAKRFPELGTFRSCDLSPASWVSVAWYPIYRIPTGPTLRDLDACFLTYHSLSTQFAAGVGRSRPNPKVAATLGVGGGAGGGVEGSGAPATTTAVRLPAFAAATYKLKAAAWTPAWRDRQLAASLAQAADAWLRLLRADHPDHRFYASRRAPPRR